MQIFTVNTAWQSYTTADYIIFGIVCVIILGILGGAVTQLVRYLKRARKGA
jgi:hypothetical protein